jgi:DNA-binding NarL/FixJ family response regulator
MAGGAQLNDIGVLIVEDDPQVRAALAGLVGTISVCRFIVSRPSADALLDWVTTYRPDVLLLDLLMPGRPPLEALAELTARGDPARVVVVSAVGEPEAIEAAFAAGASGYVLKADAPGAVREAIPAVVRGQRYLSATLRLEHPDLL